MVSTKRKADTTPAFDIRKALARGEIAPVYFLYGEEQFLIEEAVTAIRQAALPPGTEQFNLDMLAGDEMSAADILGVVTMFPMMGERRVVIVKDFDRVDEKERFIPCIENPVASTVLILVGETKDGRMKIYKSLQDNACCLPFTPLKEWQIPDWIRSRVELQGKTIEKDALELMRVYSDRSLRDLQNEIDKLFSYVGERNNIQITDVNTVVGVTRDYNIFELQKALGENNFAKALGILDWMLNTGEQPTVIVAQLTKYYQKLWVVREMRSRGKQLDEIARFLNPRYPIPKFADEYIEASFRIGEEQFHGIFESLQTTDIQLKSSGMETYTAMTLLMANLARVSLKT